MKEDLIVLLEKIDALKLEIESMRPLPPEREGRIFQKLRLDWNFHSNAIEGNSLTYGETNAFLMEGLTAKGKPLKDHLDLKGHNEAIDFLRHFIDKNEEITERDIRELHKMILVEPYKSKAISPGGQPSEKTINIGQYKTQPNHVQTATGEMFYFASPEETPAKMHDLMEWYRANRGTMHPVELAAFFHYDFVRIHPFDDGNGRMSRLLMNFILMQFGFPPVVIKASKDKKAEYFYALQMADKGGKDVFVEYIGEQLVHSMEVYLRGARGEDISEPDDLGKELSLFVKSFNDEDFVKIKKGGTTWEIDFNIQLTELLEQLNNRGSNLDNLFIDRKIAICGLKGRQDFSDLFVYGQAGSKEKLSKLLTDKTIKYLHIDFHFQGFKKCNPPINFVKKTRIKLDIFSFSFEIEDTKYNGFGMPMPFKKTIDIGYGIPILDKHIRPIENIFFKELMEEIKQKTQKE